MPAYVAALPRISKAVDEPVTTTTDLLPEFRTIVNLIGASCAVPVDLTLTWRSEIK